MTDHLRAVVYTRRLEPATTPEPHGEAPTELALRRDDGHRGSDTSGWSTLAAASLALGVLAFVVLGFTRQPTLKLGAPVALGVAVLAVPLFRWLCRGRPFDLAGIVLTGLGLKLVGVAARYDVIFGAYGGTADAGIYHTNGARLANAYRQFDFSAPADQEIPGTGFIRVVIGYVYAVLGAHITVGFIVFGLFGFLGAWFFYRAFETAMPDGNHRRYALLVFLWPSLLFWPSSLGKEAWIILGIGLAAYGGARVLAHRRGGFVIAAGGMWAVTMVRPHITVLLFAAFAIAYFLRPGAPGSSFSPAGKAIGLVFLFVISGTVIAQFQDFFGIDGFDRESIEETFAETEENSQQGGSGFAPPDPWSPIGYLMAVVTVLIRPFPWEADNVQMLGTSLEGVLLFGLLARSVPRIVRAGARLRRWAYGTLSIAYLLGFAFAFAAIANFGILARQRTQLLPFVFVLVCLPAAGWVTSRRRAGDGQSSSATDPQLTR